MNNKFDTQKQKKNASNQSFILLINKFKREINNNTNLSNEFKHN